MFVLERVSERSGVPIVCSSVWCVCIAGVARGLEGVGVGLVAALVAQSVRAVVL